MRPGRVARPGNNLNSRGDVRSAVVRFAVAIIVVLAFALVLVIIHSGRQRRGEDVAGVGVDQDGPGLAVTARVSCRDVRKLPVRTRGGFGRGLWNADVRHLAGGLRAETALLLAGLIAFAIGVSRIYLIEHYLSDVLNG